MTVARYVDWHYNFTVVGNGIRDLLEYHQHYLIFGGKEDGEETPNGYYLSCCCAFY